MTNKKNEIAYNFIKEETINEPKIYSYPTCDAGATYLVMPSGKVYGIDYAESFSTLNKIKNEPTILSMFAGKTLDVTKEHANEFLQDLKKNYELPYLMDDYKKELGENIIQLEQEINQLFTTKSNKMKM